MNTIIASLIGIIFIFVFFFCLALYQKRKLKIKTWKEWLHYQADLSRKNNCKHEYWDCDKQILVIKCQNCGKKAWIKEFKNLF